MTQLHSERSAAKPQLAQSPIRQCDGPEIFDAIWETDCAAAVWKRTPAPGFQSWIDGLPAAQLPQGRVILRPRDTSDAINELCSIANLPRNAQRDFLINDVASLTTAFADALDAPYVRLRLDVVADDGCPKFHVDSLTARLVCSYRGAGTEYGFSSDGSTPERILRVPTGAPLIMRGTLWPEAPASGFLHRSPPMDGATKTRLLLVLDPISDPEGAA
ncbi:MAG: DUF1826 domain-containing protein [Pseudomonadota bacterium]